MKSLISFAFVAVAFSVQGAIFEDNFETNAVGSSLNGVNGWTVGNLSSSQKVTVVSSPSPFSGGGHSAYYDDSDSTSTRANLTLDHQLDTITSGTFSFDFNIHAGQYQAPSFFIYDSSGSIGLQLRLDTSSNEMQVVSSGGNVSTSLGSISLDSWYNVSIVVGDVSGTSDSFDLIVKNASGTTVISQTGLSFRNDIASMSKITFRVFSSAGNSGAQFYLDNVHIGPVPKLTLWLLSLNTGRPEILCNGIYSLTGS